MKERLISIGELALVLGVNQFTVERWYKFKRLNPENDYAKLIPEPIRKPNSKNVVTRYWKESDILKWKKFQDSIVSGTKGFMRSQFIFQKNTKKRKENNNGKKKSDRRSGN